MGVTTRIAACIATIFLMISAQPALSTSNQPLTNAGTYFVTGGYSSSLTPNEDLTLYITTPENRNVSFSISGAVTKNGTVNSSTVFSHTFRSVVGGIDITSNDGVSKLVISALKTIDNNGGGDTFTVYPVQEYSSYTYYAVVVLGKDQRYKGFVNLIGTENDTNVTITPTQNMDSLTSYDCSGAAGEECKLTLDRLQSLVIRSDSDLTGTKIVSSAPLTVISGHECALVPYDFTTNCKAVVEQIPPVVTWGKNFLVAPIVGHSGQEWYKIVSSQENTNVVVFCGTSVGMYSEEFQLENEGSSVFFSVTNGRRCSIVGDKPIMVMLLAANDNEDIESDTFMVVVSPVKQYLSQVTLSIEIPQPTLSTIHSMVAMLKIPAAHCPNSQCTVLVDNDYTIDVSTRSQTILCSDYQVCGYVVNHNLTIGSHNLRIQETGGSMSVITYFISHEEFVYEVGTTGGLGLNHIAVDRPEVTVEYDGKLIAGEKLVLMCSVSFKEGLGNGIKIIPRWSRGGVEFETGSPIETYKHKTGPYIMNYTFEALSIIDSDEYRCEVDVSSDHAGILTTASGSMKISVVGYGYVQLKLVGVPKCSDWLSESEERVESLLDEVASIISKGCNCDYSSSYLTKPTFQCAPDQQDSTTTLLLQTRVQVGGDVPTDYGAIVDTLEAAADTAISFRAILLTVGSTSDKCGIAIDNIQSSPDCFPTGQPISTPCTSGVTSNDDNNTILIVVVVVCVVIVIVVILVMVIVVLVVVTKSHRNSAVPDPNQRPKSIHLHTRLAHGGDSVTSFSPHSGSPNGSNVYIEKEPSSSPSVSFSIPQSNGIRNSASPRHHHQYSSSSLSTTTTTDGNEHELNYKTMKTNMSEVELIPTITHL